MKLYKEFKKSKKYSIKWDNYFSIYEKAFNSLKKKKLKILEIGIGDGGSLFMWKKFFKKGSEIYGIDLNPEALSLKKYGFNITIGDQSKKSFWRSFYKKNKKFDVIIDDGGHTNIQQITTLMESVNNVNDGGKIIFEDTHTSFMKKKGFNNPSKYSLYSFANKIVESIHRRNPNLKKNMNLLSKIIYSIEFYDSIIIFNIDRKKCVPSKNLENNISLRKLFTDYRFKKEKKSNYETDIPSFIDKNFSKRSPLFKFFENRNIIKYLKNLD